MNEPYKMAFTSRKSKSGPFVPWQMRARYQRSRCIERLKPNQIENLSAADAFARWHRRPLNTFVTIQFLEPVGAKRCFERGIDCLSKWHTRWGGEWSAIHVWEAVGGLHVHLACHCPKQSNTVHEAIHVAFAGHDVHITTRKAGQGMMAYVCKGTDVVTHSKLHGPRHIKARSQGVILWKRCGTTQNIGKAARVKAGFEAKIQRNNCVKTSPRVLNASELQRIAANTNGDKPNACPSLVVSHTLKSHLNSDTKHGSRERVAGGDLDASRHALPEPMIDRTRAQARAFRSEYVMPAKAKSNHRRDSLKTFNGQPLLTLREIESALPIHLEKYLPWQRVSEPNELKAALAKLGGEIRKAA
jgi:hypothetical protein